MINKHNPKLKLPIDENATFEIKDIADILDVLLSDNGCPWDRKQRKTDIRKYLLEECYEVIEAINLNDNDGLCEELGDVLFQILFLAKLSEKENSFNFDNVIDRVCKKMISRHTHIFSEDIANNSGDVIEIWEENKNKEKKYTSVYEKLRKVPKELPALMRAQKVLEKADSSGVDVPSFEESLEYINNSAKSVEKWIKAEYMENYGDYLLNLVNIFRYLQLNAELTLTNATETFINRFENIKE